MVKEFGISAIDFIVEPGKTAAIELKDVYDKTEGTPGKDQPTVDHRKKDDEKAGPANTNPDGTSKKEDDKADKKTAASTGEGGSSSEGGSAKSSGGSKSRGSVGTGDDTDVATPAVTAIIALGAIMALLRKKRNQNME